MIEVGEYVRTKRGDIFKLAKFYSDDILYSMQDVKGILHGNPDKTVKSHSHNIIDLIEVGDYVNGQRVISIEDGLIDIGQEEDYIWLGEEDIKTIVTHEQMKSIEYRVGGEDDK